MEKVKRKPNTIYTLSLSYGKDSLACLGAIEKLGLPLDRIVHAEVWATQEIPADLPPMVEFKAKADEIILKRYGIKVEHVSAINKNAGGGVQSYEQVFNTKTNTSRYGEHIYGFPKQRGAWCTSKLKQELLTKANLRRYFLSTVETTWGGYGKLMDSRQELDNGVRGNSKEESSTRMYGFPIKWGQWCNSMLKIKALKYGVRKQVESVLHRGTQEIPSQESFLQALERRAV